MLKDLMQNLESIGCNYRLNEPLAKHTTWKVGGPADVLCLPESVETCLNILKLFSVKDIPYIILGNGSNVLVGDKGYPGVVVKLIALNNMGFEENLVAAGCGTSLPALAVEAAKRSLSGAEFLAGIPGTVGAAVKNNAGAYGAKISDIFHSAVVWHDGIKKEIFLQDMQYGYRSSAFKNTSAVFLMAKFQLAFGDKKNIKHKMQQNIKDRRDKQPLEFPNAGSVFTNPAKDYAGKLITDAGLKGKSIGGAAVSMKHANFIVNTGNATAEDIKKLILLVQQEVATFSGTTLEPEVEFIGKF